MYRFVPQLRLLLQLEELQQTIDIQQYAIESTTLERAGPKLALKVGCGRWGQWEVAGGAR